MLTKTREGNKKVPLPVALQQGMKPQKIMY